MNILNNKINIYIILFFIILVALGIRLYKISESFYYLFESISAQFGQPARNYLRFDFKETLPVNLFNGGKIQDQPLMKYLSYTPFPSLLISFFGIFLEINETLIRIISLLIYFFAAFLFYKVLKLIYNIETIFFTIIIFLFFSITIHYSRVYFHENLSSPFMLLIFYFYYLWITTENKKYFKYIVIFHFLGLLFNFDLLFIPFTLIILQICFKRKNTLKLFFWNILTNVFFSLIFLCNHIYHSNGFDAFLKKLFYRSIISKEVTFFIFLKGLIDHYFFHYSYFIGILIIITGIIFIFKNYFDKNKLLFPLYIILNYTMYIFFFKQAAYTAFCVTYPFSFAYAVFIGYFLYLMVQKNYKKSTIFFCILFILFSVYYYKNNYLKKHYYTPVSFGKAINKVTDINDIILTNYDFSSENYYFNFAADRWVIFNIKSKEDIENILTKYKDKYNIVFVTNKADSIYNEIFSNTQFKEEYIYRFYLLNQKSNNRYKFKQVD